MKAIVCTRYGSPDVLELREVPTPRPGKNDLLVKVRATTVCAADYRVRGLNVPPGFRLLTRLGLGFFKPRAGILGTEFAGVVHETGSEVVDFAPGDEVFGSTGVAFAANAEYVCIDQSSRVVEKPPNISFEEAAALPFGASTALHFLRNKADLQAGQRLLVYGASGSVGTAAVQIAVHLGAHVTAVCGPANVEMVRSLGARKVIDYTKEDFARETYDVILETTGKTTIASCLKALTPGGICLRVVAGIPDYFRMGWYNLVGNRRVAGGVSSESRADLEFIAELARTKRLRAVIDRRYPLEQTAQAHRYADPGHKKGNLVIIPG